jgi:hypothetical protein
MRTHIRLLALAMICVTVGVLAGIATGGAATSKKSSSSAKAKAVAAAKARFAHRGGPGRPGGPPPFGHGGPGGPGVHSEAVVLNKAGDGFITVTSDAGTVKSVSGQDVTITQKIGTVVYKDDVTITVPADAKVIRNHADAKLSDLSAGDRVHIVVSSEFSAVIAEDAAFAKSEHDRFGGGPRDFGRESRRRG